MIGVQLSREKVAKTALNGDREQNVGSSELREGGALRLGGGVKKAPLHSLFLMVEKLLDQDNPARPILTEAQSNSFLFMILFFPFYDVGCR